MAGIFLGYLHIPGIFAGIQVFFRVIEEHFVQNHGVSRGFSPRTPKLMLNICRFIKAVVVCRRACEVHFAAISIFRKSQVFFRGNYFFSSAGPPVVLRLESPPWEAYIVFKGAKFSVLYKTGTW